MHTETRISAGDHRHLIELIADGRAVSSLVVWDLHLWMRGSQVRIGGIGGVQTAADERNKGHARKLLEAAIAYMLSLGQDVSFLIGIPDLYHKFGFVPCMAETTLRSATRDLERAGADAPPAALRRMRTDDLPFVVGLYNDTNCQRPGTVVRDGRLRIADWGRWNLGPATPYILEDPRGQRLGYTAYLDSPTETTVVEAAAVERGAYRSLLAGLARVAVERRCGHVVVHAPADHPLAMLLKGCGSEVRTMWARNSEAMMRILRQEPFLRGLAGTFSARLEDSRFRGTRVDFRIHTELESSVLDLGVPGGPVVTAGVSLSSAALIQVVMGYRTARDVLQDAGAWAEGDAEPVLEAMVRGETPYLWATDYF